MCFQRRDYSFNGGTGCPDGTEARLMARAGETGFKRNVCVPNTLLGGRGDGPPIGEEPTAEGDALDFKQGDGGCSLTPTPAASSRMWEM